MGLCSSHKRTTTNAGSNTGGVKNITHDLTSPKRSAARDHVTTCGFDVNVEHFTIIDGGGKRDLTLLEPIQIYKRNARSNNTASAEPLRILGSFVFLLCKV